MNKDRPSDLLDRAPETPSSVEQADPEAAVVVPRARAGAGTPVPQPRRRASATRRPRRWNDPDEKLMIWGMLAVAGLSVYAAVFITLAVWLSG